MVQIEWMVIKSVQYRNQTVSPFKILEPITLFQESWTIRLELSIWSQFYSS